MGSDWGDFNKEPTSRDITDEVKEAGTAGPAYVGQGEDRQDTATMPEAAPLPYPVLTLDQMLRSQALEFASRHFSGANMLQEAKRYYKFLVGAEEN